MEIVVADGRNEAAGPGSIAQQGGGVGAVGHHVVVKGEHLDEAQAEEAVVAAHDHVDQGTHHQQQGTHLPMLAGVYGLYTIAPLLSMRRVAVMRHDSVHVKAKTSWTRMPCQ